MTIPEIFEIAIPALTGIATLLRILTRHPRATTAAKKQLRVVVIDGRPQRRKKNDCTVKSTIRDGSEFNHCTHIEI